MAYKNKKKNKKHIRELHAKDRRMKNVRKQQRKNKEFEHHNPYSLDDLEKLLF